MANFKFIDLFSGIGGFHIAAKAVGGNCIGYCEIASDAIEAYCQNFNISKEDNLGDITQIKTLPEHDFMTAGVPCQSWSIAGKKLGFDDDRGQLWNDTIYLLNKTKPKAFIFENVKGLADPRNRTALLYILDRIKEAGYFANAYLLNAYDYGSPQTRIRIYIVGFKDKKFQDRFYIPLPQPGSVQLIDVLDGFTNYAKSQDFDKKPKWSLSCNDQGFNDYFLFNDLRNGETTIHSWDIIETTEREKYICYLLLKNRRKSIYGVLDGNPLSIEHFQQIDKTITISELETLVSKNILKHVSYIYKIVGNYANVTENEAFLLSQSDKNKIVVDKLKLNKEFRKRKINISNMLAKLENDGIINCIELRYDFKNTKISTGLNGINRIFLPTSKIYPTMVASDTNDYVSTTVIQAANIVEWKNKFMTEIFKTNKFRKITKSEACKIQGFPSNFVLPTARSRWMHLIGNSVAVTVVKTLTNAIVTTGVFGEEDWNGKQGKRKLFLFVVLVLLVHFS